MTLTHAYGGFEHTQPGPFSQCLFCRVEAIIALLELVPCQMVTTVEDCDVIVATHVRHPERYEKLPRSEWCARCDALARARELVSA